MKKFLLIAAPAIIIISCKKNIEEITPVVHSNLSAPHTFKGTDVKAINESLDKAARVIAASLKQKAVRSFIKAEAQKRIDGEFNVLYKSTKHIYIDGPSLETILTERLQSVLFEATKFESLIANVPNFQISVPVHCEDWDANEYIPLVAISEQGVDDTKRKKIKAYNSDGNVVWLDAQTKPDRPVVAVGLNERLDEHGKLKYALQENGTAVDLKLASALAAAPRQNGGPVLLNSILCTNIGGLESWVNQELEIVVRVYGSKLTTPSTASSAPAATLLSKKSYSNISMNAANGVWYPISFQNQLLLPWYRWWSAPTTTHVYGSDAVVLFEEDDPNVTGAGANIPVTLGGTIKASDGSTVNVAVGTSYFHYADDEYAGKATIKFGLPIGQVYTTDSPFYPISFKIY